jgi:transcriptional regulator with XRE-family HTH domain
MDGAAGQLAEGCRLEGEALNHGGGGATESRKRLAARLRQAREEAGRSEAEAAMRLDCPVERFERIEAGLATIRVAEIRSVLEFYGVTGERRDDLLGEAEHVRDRAWWHRYADLIDESFETMLILESDAASLRTYQPNLVPGLLQTERYAWELIGTRADLPLETVRRQASLRAMRRQVLDRDDPPRLAVILEEAVLRRPVGKPAVMREQYGYLADISGTPTVSIQVLPFSAGPHRAMGSGFHIYGFAEREHMVVELELLDRVRFIGEARHADHYATAFQQASLRALDVDQSRAMLKELAGKC